MSLRVWLPLNGDTNNYGLSNISMSGSPKSWSAGTIGKCATWAGSTSNVVYNTTKELNYTDNFSFALWVKPTWSTSATTSQYAFTIGRADAGGYGYGLWYNASGNLKILFGNQQYSVSVTDSAWVHIAFTKSGTAIKIYKDGSIYTSTTFGGTLPTYSDGNGIGLGCFHYSGNIYPFYGSINDFRVYNHCLSVKEVKEISMGLAVHYKLDNLSGIENPNILNSSQAGIGRDSKTLDDDGTYIGLTKGTGGWSEAYIYTYPVNTIAVANIVGKSYTISGLVKWSTVSDTILGASYLCYGGFTASGERTYDINVALTSYKIIGSNKAVSAANVSANTWYHVYYTFTIPTTWTTASVYLRLQIKTAAGVTSGTNFYYKQLKMEEGTTPTEWCPNASDAMYTTFGYDKTTVCDCSGFGNDATIYRSPVLSTSSVLYKACMNSNYTGYIANTSLGLTLPKMSVSFWFNPTQESSKMQHFLFGTFNSWTNNGMGMWTDNNTTATRSYSFIVKGDSLSSHTSITIGTTFTCGTWYHFVMTYDGANVKTYVNGTLTSTTACASGTISNPNIYIGNSMYSSAKDSETENAKFSDFRIYGTALTQADVTKLYKVREEIDKDGNLYIKNAYETDGNANFTKTGLSLANNYTEMPIYYDNTVYQESDGSLWLRISHHNNPASYLFASSDTFTTQVRKDDNRWFNVSFCNYVSNSGSYELMIKQKATSDGTEQKFRWTQTTNPMAGDYSSTARSSGNVTFTSLSGYTTTTYGGIYKLNNNTYICMNNGTNGNWFGAIGSWNAWNKGIPGVNGVAVTTGYLDLYIRIDNLDTYNVSLGKTSIEKTSLIHSNYIEEF